MTSRYLAIVLDDESRTKLLKRCNPPLHPSIRAEHITIWTDDLEEYKRHHGLFRVGDRAMEIETVGYFHNDRVDCVLVKVNGEVVREDGSHYHVTMSVAEGAKASESKELIKQAFDSEALVSLFSFSLRGTVQLLYRSS